MTNTATPRPVFASLTLTVGDVDGDGKTDLSASFTVGPFKPKPIKILNVDMVQALGLAHRLWDIVVAFVPRLPL